MAGCGLWVLQCEEVALPLTCSTTVEARPRRIVPSWSSTTGRSTLTTGSSSARSSSDGSWKRLKGNPALYPLVLPCPGVFGRSLTLTLIPRQRPSSPLCLPVPCVVPLVPCVVLVPLVPCVVPLVPCVVPLVPCVGSTQSKCQSAQLLLGQVASPPGP